MSDLSRFETSASLQVPEAALASAEPADWLRQHHVPVFGAEVLQPPRSLDAMSDLVKQTMASFAPFDAKADAAMAIPLHQALRLTRREAADARLWGWLGIAMYPEYVAHRWAPSSRSGLRSSERFGGDRVRQTFARLWWAAELTVGGDDDYSLTQRLFALPGFQDVYEGAFGRMFCGYRPAMAAFVDSVASKPEKVVRETVKQFGNLLSTVVLESMEEPEIAFLLTDLADRVEKKVA